MDSKVTLRLQSDGAGQMVSTRSEAVVRRPWAQFLSLLTLRKLDESQVWRSQRTGGDGLRCQLRRGFGENVAIFLQNHKVDQPHSKTQGDLSVCPWVSGLFFSPTQALLLLAKCIWNGSIRFKSEFIVCGYCLDMVCNATCVFDVISQAYAILFQL